MERIRKFFTIKPPGERKASKKSVQEIKCKLQVLARDLVEQYQFLRAHVDRLLATIEIYKTHKDSELGRISRSLKTLVTEINKTVFSVTRLGADLELSWVTVDRTRDSIATFAEILDNTNATYKPEIFNHFTTINSMEKAIANRIEKLLPQPYNILNPGELRPSARIIYLESPEHEPKEIFNSDKNEEYQVRHQMKRQLAEISTKYRGKIRLQYGNSARCIGIKVLAVVLADRLLSKQELQAIARSS